MPFILAIGRNHKIETSEKKSKVKFTSTHVLYMQSDDLHNIIQMYNNVMWD